MTGPGRLLAVLLCALATCAHAGEYFKIQVVDEQTGRGVPLVELKTTGSVRYYTDSNGIVAFHEPGLMDRRVFFHVSSHGYEFPKDGFGYRGKAIQVSPGGSATLKIKRTNIAQRLYRVTGGGIYRDSLLTGVKAPTRNPVLNGLVLGSDSVVNAVYRGKIHWFWGDTNRPRYPLGLFHVPGAVSDLPAKGGLPASVGVDLTYFVGDDGFAKPMAKMPGKGPTWINGLVTLPDKDGRERLYGYYVKVKPPLTIYQHGMIVFDDDKQEFSKVLEFPEDSLHYPHGHPFKHVVDGTEYIYFPQPFPLLRVRADVESLKDPARYEAYTPLKKGSRLDDPQLDRTAAGKLRYGWKRNTPVVAQKQQRKLVADGNLKAGEGLIQLRDRDTGKKFAAHGGSVYFNRYRNRWAMIVLETFGTSLLGEVWYAEADTPTGPWAYAVKVVTHNKYSFYNPKQHPFFSEQNGRLIYFEGTYTTMFSGNENPTPRYNYNQIMYRLDLADPRAALPVAVYDVSEDHTPTRFATYGNHDSAVTHPIAFFALDRLIPDCVPIYLVQSETTPGRLVARAPAISVKPVFFALSTDTDTAPATTTLLYEFINNKSGHRAYNIDPDWSRDGFRRAEKPLCRVWRIPSTHWPSE